MNMEKTIAIGLVLVILVSLPLVNAQAFQTKDLQSGSVSIKAQLVKKETVPGITYFTIKNAVFNFSNTKLTYTFIPYSAPSVDSNLFFLAGSMKIKNSQIPNLNDVIDAYVFVSISNSDIQNASGVTKYSFNNTERTVNNNLTSASSADSDSNRIKIGDATWPRSHVTGELIVLDNGSATLSLEGKPS
jgi:hypothetical protein